MNRNASFITVSTPDLDAARAFYVDGLGWEPTLDVPDEILFFQVASGVLLGLFEAEKFAADLGPEIPPEAPRGLTLSQNVDSPAAVDDVFQTAIQAGGRAVKTPRQAAFGGYHCHVADPNGLIWEIAFNPGWHVEETGCVHLGEVPTVE